MAIYGNKTNKKVEYKTDEAGMLADAKEYAKRDFPLIKLVAKELNLNRTEKELADALIQVKLGQIKHARLERDTYFD